MRYPSYMRIHSDLLTSQNLRNAAAVARVDFTRYGEGKSRSHARFFDVILTGESRRHQNGGPDKAATWDQWGVFLSELFGTDPDMVCGTVKRPIYADADDFAYKTADRFGAPEVVMTSTGYANKFFAYGEPNDAHGDHTFRFSGVPYQQKCTKCTAVTRWQ